MKKRFNLLFILTMGLIMLLSLAACNKQTSDPNKLPNDINSGTSSGTEVETTASLKFSFPIEPSSVFNSIYVDEFDLESYVQYSIAYSDKKTGALIRKVPMGSVKSDMISESDLAKLTVAGHHSISVTAEVDGKKVTGSFRLHLKDRSGKVTLVDYEFDLADKNGGGTAKAFFGETKNSKATVKVEKGYTFETWNEFIDTFKMTLSGRALQSVSVKGSDKVLSVQQGFPFVIEGGMSFETAWTDDVVKVKFELNTPDGTVVNSAHSDPKLLFAEGGVYHDVSAARGSGRVIQPSDKEIDVYNGYYFAGWFNKADDTLWKFAGPVGEKDLTLYAKWFATDYGFTIYTMGGKFAPGLKPAEENGVVITAKNAQELGYTVVTAESRFGLSDNDLNRVTFSGFRYGVDYDKYVAEVQVASTGEKVMLKFKDFYHPDVKNPLFARGGDYLVVDDLYTEYQCINKIPYGTKVDVEHPVAYIKWRFNEPEAGANYEEEFSDRISRLYTELLYKDGIGFKADGSVRLEKIADYSLNELIVPAELIINGVRYPLSEIGKEACANVKALTKVDLSRASNLTTIGEEAFATNTYLEEIVMPEDNNISEIGKDAFVGTKFENEYYARTGGAEFIVINRMIYKFVGQNRQRIDLSQPAYYSPTSDMSAEVCKALNEQLAAVNSIENGAFANCTALVALKLSDNIRTIKNNAFYGLAKFASLELNQESKLEVIEEQAFDGSGFLTKNNALYSPEYEAVIIGGVYYRFMNASATKATVPAIFNNFAVKYIAPYAFKNCNALADVQFEKQNQIQSIGKDAFLDTALIKNNAENDNFTFFNGILTAYYGATLDANRMHLIVPEKVRKISSYAFGYYARYFETVQINSNVKSIAANAFSGATMLKSIIFPDIKAGNGKLDNAPMIDDNAFADANGAMIEDVTLYFGNDALAYLAKLAAGEETTADAATLGWLKLYKLNSKKFVAEDIKSVVLDRSKIRSTLLRTNKTENVYKDNYPAAVKDALIITNNTGAQRTSSLEWSENDMQLVLITNGENDKYKSLYEEGKLKYVVTYKLNKSSKGCPIEADDPDLFVITVINAVKGNPAFNTESTPFKANEYNKNNVFWIEGIEGQVEGKPYPTFYTSVKDVEIVFCYKDITAGDGADAEVKRLKTTVYGFDTKATVAATRATICVDFYGLGRYWFEFTYSVQESKYEKLEQTGAIVIPINGDPVAYLAQNTVNLIGQDKIAKAVPLNSTFKIPTVDTSTLGMHTVRIEYNRSDATKLLELNLVYTVVLVADESLFKYEVFNDAANTARITACLADKSKTETMVLPSQCTINGKRYTIRQIGFIKDQSQGVFSGFENLKAVYLPETIRNLGVNTFEGCRLLSNVYTALQADAEVLDIPIDKKYFTAYGSAYQEIAQDGVEWTVQPVMLNTLEGLEYGKEVVINGDYVVKNDAKEKLKYRIVRVKDKLVVNGKSGEIDLYLPDSIFTVVNIVDNQEDPAQIDPIFYANGSDFMFKTVNRAPDGLLYIGAGTFKECVSLKGIDLSNAVDLEFIGAMAFYNSGLTSIDLSKNVLLKSVSNQTFQNCAMLDNVVLPSEVQYIGNNAFDGCIVLTKLSGYGTELKRIDSAAFNRCLSLTEFTLYETLAIVGGNAFASCGALTLYCTFDGSVVPSGWSDNWNGTECPIVWNCLENEADENGFIYASIDGIRYALNLATGRAIVAGQQYILEGEIVIPQEVRATVTVGGVKKTANFIVTTIGKNAFGDNARIKKVTVSSRLKFIEQYAFRNCTALTGFEFSGKNSLAQVATTAFEGCSVSRPTASNIADANLAYVVADSLIYVVDVANKTASVAGIFLPSQSIVIPETINVTVNINGRDDRDTYRVVGITANAFEGNGELCEVTIPSSVKTVGERAFVNCRALTVYCSIPESSIEGADYSWHENWKDKETPVVWDCDNNDVASDGKIYYVDSQSGLRYTVSTADNTAAVVVQSSLLAGDIIVGDTVSFSVGGSMKAFTVTAIGDNAFDGNGMITAVVLTSTVKTIGARAFANCVALTEFVFDPSNEVETVAPDAFDGCAVNPFEQEETPEETPEN